MSAPVLRKKKRPTKIVNKRRAINEHLEPEPEILNRSEGGRPQGIRENADGVEGGLPNPFQHPPVDPRLAAQMQAQLRSDRQRAVRNVGDDWRKLKGDLLAGIDRKTLSTRDQRDIRGKVGTLYDQFDRGLSATLKKAAEAKGDDAKAALRAVITTVEEYTTKATAAKAKWQSDGTASGTQAAQGADEVLRRLSTIEAESKKTLHAVWPDEYPNIVWAATTQAKISGQGATGVVLDYEGTGPNQQLKRILKASEDPFGQLLLANLLHAEIAEVKAPAVFDVTIDRNEILQHVLNVLQPPTDPRRAQAPQILQADFSNPQKTLFAFDVAPGADLKTLAKDPTTQPQLDTALASEQFWVALGRVSVVDRFLGIDDRLVAGAGSNLGNIMLGARPGDVAVIDNYDANTQKDIRAGNTSPEVLLAALGPDQLDSTARQIALGVQREVHFEKGLADAAPSAVDLQLVEYFKNGVRAGTAALVTKFLEPAYSQALQDAVAVIRQKGSESGLTRDAEGLEWKTLLTRAKFVRDNVRGPLAP